MDEAAVETLSMDIDQSLAVSSPSTHYTDAPEHMDEQADLDLMAVSVCAELNQPQTSIENACNTGEAFDSTDMLEVRAINASVAEAERISAFVSDVIELSLSGALSCECIEGEEVVAPDDVASLVAFDVSVDDGQFEETIESQAYADVEAHVTTQSAPALVDTSVEALSAEQTHDQVSSPPQLALPPQPTTQTQPLPSPQTAPQPIYQSDDDFGDFEDLVTDTPFEQSFSPTHPLCVSKQSSQTQAIAGPTSEQAAFTVKVKARKKGGDRLAFKTALGSLLGVKALVKTASQSRPFARKILQCCEDGEDIYLTVPCDEARMIVEMQTDAAYMDTMTNRWRGSATQKSMNEILGRDVKSEPEHLLEEDLKTKMVNPERGIVKEFVGKEGRDDSFTLALEMCQMREDTLMLKTPEELEAIKQSLLELARQMQEQAGYWLDAKEQLVMDAEMHNKMISSLVGFAQQQQVALSLSKKTKAKTKK